MISKTVKSEEFKKYGRVLDINVSDLLEKLGKTEITDGVVYVASSEELESCKEFNTIQDNVYGGMPIQIGYCNGKNSSLNAVEYHRDSEINVVFNGAKFIVGLQKDITDDYTYDTAKMEVFHAEPGEVVELFATTLHFAPCNLKDEGFKVGVVLPKGTNTNPPEIEKVTKEDELLKAKNKWLIAHEEWASKNNNGAYVGLIGENIKL